MTAQQHPTGYIGGEGSTTQYEIVGALGLMALSYFLSHDQLYSMPTPYLAILLIGFGFFLYKSAGWAEKAFSPKLVIGAFHSTTDGTIHTVGNWCIARCGGTLMPEIHQTGPGNDGAAVFPRYCATSDHGLNVVPNAHFRKVTFDVLPRDARKFLLDHDIRGPYFLGLAPSAAYKEMPALSFLQTENEEMNRENTFLTGMLSKDEKVLEKPMRFAKRARHLATDQSVFSRFLKKKQEEEQQ